MTKIDGVQLSYVSYLEYPHVLCDPHQFLLMSPVEFSEANCQLLYHRGCASIPPARYRELSTSDEPFVCLSCTVLDQRCEIAELHSTVTALREELHKVTNMQESKMTAISAEVTKLKQALSDRKQSERLRPSSRRTPATRVPRPSKRTYAAAAGFVTLQHLLLKPRRQPAMGVKLLPPATERSMLS